MVCNGLRRWIVPNHARDKGKNLPPTVVKTEETRCAVEVPSVDMRAGLDPSEAAECCGDRGHVETFERAYRLVSHLGVRVTWLAVLDLTVGYAGGYNGENHRDQWPRVEYARKEIRRQQNEERYGRGQDGDDDRQRTAVTAPGAVDQNTCPVAGRGRDQPGEGDEEEHVRNWDAGDSDPDASENTPEDLIRLHDAGPRSSW